MKLISYIGSFVWEHYSVFSFSHHYSIKKLLTCCIKKVGFNGALFNIGYKIINFFAPQDQIKASELETSRKNKKDMEAQMRVLEYNTIKQFLLKWRHLGGRLPEKRENESRNQSEWVLGFFLSLSLCIYGLLWFEVMVVCWLWTSLEP